MAKYKVVPVEPTPEMEQAAEKYWNDRKFKALSGDPRTWKGLYETMCAAAPDMQGELVAWATRLYNTGHHAGHHDTVEGGYTHVYHQDMDSYHEDIVQEWMEDNPYPAGQHPDAQGEPDVSALVEALEEIGDPIRFMEERLEEGERLNGMAAVQLAGDASYLRGIATDALATYHNQGADQ